MYINILSQLDNLMHVADIYESTFFYITTALFWVITERVLVIPYRRLGTTYRRLFRNVGSVSPLLAA